MKRRPHGNRKKNCNSFGCKYFEAARFFTPEMPETYDVDKVCAKEG